MQGTEMRLAFRTSQASETVLELVVGQPQSRTRGEPDSMVARSTAAGSSLCFPRSEAVATARYSSRISSSTMLYSQVIPISPFRARNALSLQVM